VSEPYPAWTAIGISELAVPGGLVEIKVIARMRGAGLDIFAYRQLQWARELTIYEVDHPITQRMGHAQRKASVRGIELLRRSRTNPLELPLTWNTSRRRQRI
jgi:hypothetical protein